MIDYLREMWSGAGHTRVFIQPLLAIFLGLLDGIRDHKQGVPPFVVSLFRKPATDRRTELKVTLRRILVPLTITVAASIAFQYINSHRVHFLVALAYAVLFVAIPYGVARGLANRGEHAPTRAPRGKVPQT